MGKRNVTINNEDYEIYDNDNESIPYRLFHIYKKKNFFAHDTRGDYYKILDWYGNKITDVKKEIIQEKQKLNLDNDLNSITITWNYPNITPYIVTPYSKESYDYNFKLGLNWDYYKFQSKIDTPLNLPTNEEIDEYLAFLEKADA